MRPSHLSTILRAQGRCARSNRNLNNATTFNTCPALLNAYQYPQACHDEHRNHAVRGLPMRYYHAPSTSRRRIMMAELLASSQRQIQRSFVAITKTSASSPEVTTAQPIQNQSMVQETSAQNENIIQQDIDSIIITASAVQQINHLANLKRPDQPEQLFLRVYVDPGGCSGFQYKFELENRDDEDVINDEEDILVNCINPADGTEALVVIDEASLELLEGSTIDYVRELIRSSFTVSSNPNSESACGCGSSFAIKNFEKNNAL